MTEIRLSGVTKHFGKTAVITACDLTIGSGEFFTFVGPSGCGKSTMLNLIAGLEQVTGGTIYFDAVAVNDRSPRERDVAMVFQSYALYPHMTVYENIAFPLRMKRMPRKTVDAEVKQATALLGLDGELLSRKPKELSGGQRQRVALGRAIVRRPKVFLLDEPLSNLDARLRIEMRAELKRLHRELKITTVYVSHDQAEAMGLSDRIGVLHQGTIQQCGTPFEVYNRPATMFVAGFMGSQPINFMPAGVRSRDPLVIECNGMSFPLEQALPAQHDRLMVGIRPEDSVIGLQPGAHAQAVTVELVESSGSVNWVDVSWNSRRFRGAARPDERLQVGGGAFVSIAVEKVLVFDAVSGVRIG